MLGNFTYYNPTKLYFGTASLENLEKELVQYGKNIAIVYGGGAIKKIKVYDEVILILKRLNKNIVEISDVMPNPTVHKLYEGIEIARNNQIDFILAIGGGSVVDYAKALSVSLHCKEDPWVKYFENLEEPSCEITPVGVILTMVATGSEMNTGTVITHPEKKLKISADFKDERVLPKFAILNPNYTLSVPHYQMIAGIFDILSHLLEQYFSDTDDNTSDYISEGIMRSVIYSGLKAVQNSDDYEARSNLMWSATWALNGLVGKGKATDWMVHMIGQSVGAICDATHGMCLSAISLAYYRMILPYAVAKFARFARNVWNVDTIDKTEFEIAELGLNALENWMTQLGLVLHLKDLGVSLDMIDDIVDGTFILNGGYLTLTKIDIRNILIESI